MGELVSNAVVDGSGLLWKQRKNGLLIQKRRNVLVSIVPAIGIGIFDRVPIRGIGSGAISGCKFLKSDLSF